MPTPPFQISWRISGASAKNFAPKSKQTSNNVKEVWGQYPSPAIVRGNILAYQLMQISLSMDGGNDYLGHVLHSNAGEDFINTVDGVALVEHV